MAFQIETKRLLLDDVRKEDCPILMAQAVEPQARSGILSYQADENYNRNFLARAISEAGRRHRTHYTLAVRLKVERILIGSCTIAEVRPKFIETNIGWHFGSRYWGNGFATEAARALLFIGFALNDVAAIYADCFADNLASIRIMEKIGMTTNGRLDLFNRIRGLSYGENKPIVRYIISKEAWKEQRNRLSL